MAAAFCEMAEPPVMSLKYCARVSVPPRPLETCAVRMAVILSAVGVVPKMAA